MILEKKVWSNFWPSSPQESCSSLTKPFIDFLSQVYSRFAVRATMSLIFDLKKIGIKWNSVSFLFGYSTRTSKYGKKNENGRQTNFVMKETVFLSPCCFSKAFLVLSKVCLKIFEEFFRVKNVKSLYLMELFGDMKANAKETYLDVGKMRKQNIF